MILKLNEESSPGYWSFLSLSLAPEILPGYCRNSGKYELLKFLQMSVGFREATSD
jgi:hypothetical protein